jgi:hypothetical protein
MEPPCPLTALGIDGGLLLFSDGHRTLRATWAEIVTPEGMLSLFGGNDAWLRDRFPRAVIVADRAGGGRPVTVGFDVTAAAAILIGACYQADFHRQAKRQASPQRTATRVQRMVALLRRVTQWFSDMQRVS